MPLKWMLISLPIYLKSQYLQLSSIQQPIMYMYHEREEGEMVGEGKEYTWYMNVNLNIDLFGANSHLVQSRLKSMLRLLSLIQVTPLGGKELPSLNHCNKNSSRPEMPTKQLYSKKLPPRELPWLSMAFFCCSAVLLASQVCLNLCYSDWETVALSHQGV